MTAQVPPELEALARVHDEKRLIIDTDGHRETVDLMLQNNIVLRYQNDDPWVDLHPAVRDMPNVVAEIAQLAEEKRLKKSEPLG